MGENPTTTVTTGPVVDTDEQPVVAAAATDDYASLLDAGFDEDAAAEIRDTKVAAPEAVAEMQTGLRPDELAQRVALFRLRVDNTASMSDIFTLALMAHDRALDTIQRVTDSEPVDVLGSASLMNGQDTLLYPYTRLASIPRFGTAGDVFSYNEAARRLPLHGMTAWFDLFAQDLAGTAEQMATLEDSNKTVYGMVGLLTDGFDNASNQQTISGLAKMVRGYRRMKTLVPFVIYVGDMPAEGGTNYEYERQNVRNRIDAMRRRDFDGDGIEINDTELYSASLEELVRVMFTSAGFDPTMVFMPGQDPRAIVQAFVTVSKLMASVSKGQMPEGLTDI
jgi:hypothetical protein